MSGLVIFWTGPPAQGFCCVILIIAGCGHVSSLLARCLLPVALMKCACRVPVIACPENNRLISIHYP